MAMDSWVPRRFGSLSSRLTSGHGILVIGLASLAALIYARGNVSTLVIMYAINVFLTFSLSMAGMLKDAIFPGRGGHRRFGEAVLFLTGLLICLSILGVTTYQKFYEAGWLTLGVTGAITGGCYLVRMHYRNIGRLVASLDREIPKLPDLPEMPPSENRRDGQTAAILVGGYGGLGINTTRDVIRQFKAVYQRIVFVSVGVVDASSLQYGVEAEQVLQKTRAACRQYVELAARYRVPATWRATVATSANDELESLCSTLATEYDSVTFFAGQLVFDRPRWYHQWLHNNTAFDLQSRLLVIGQTMVIMPRLVALKPVPKDAVGQR
jgi:hypothetical protein